MAQVSGPIKLRGSMGGTTFKKGRGKKRLAMNKQAVSGARMKQHDAYSSLRRNASKMGSASSCAGLLRVSLANLLAWSHDSGMVNRLNAEMRKVVKKDTMPNEDRRQVVRPENLPHLLGFNFNEKVSLRAAFNVAYKTNINRGTGEVTINISSFKPSRAIKGPKYATHFKIVSNAVELDIYNQTENHGWQYTSDIFKIDSTITSPFIITHKVTPGATVSILIALGLEFIEETGNYYATREQKRVVNPSCLVAINNI